MCTVSMIGDFYSKKWEPQPWYPNNWPSQQVVLTGVSKIEFDALKKEVADLKELLKLAKKYDEDHNEPDCEVESKMSILRKVAKAVGIDLDDVLAKPRQE